MKLELLVQFKESYGVWNILTNGSCLCVTEEGHDTWPAGDVWKPTLCSALLSFVCCDKKINSCEGYEAITAVVMKSYVFWDITSCNLTSCFRSGLLIGLFFYPEDGGDMFLQKVN
jgi:hypothetical protein